MFFNENDVASIRFEELDPVVDYFVIVNGGKTFRGDKKPDYFDHTRFLKYKDKIRMVYYDDALEMDAWDRETRQRNAISLGLYDAKTEDMVIISDCDEIPRRQAIVDLLNDNTLDYGPVSLMMDVYCAGINYLTPNQHTIKVCHMGDFTTAQEVRKAENRHIIPHAGWEFSSLGTAETISKKLKSFSHYELDMPDITDPDRIRERLSRHEDPYGWGLTYEVVPVDDTWPEAIKNDREYWSKYEWQL
jgi:hypothetical protein